MDFLTGTFLILGSVVILVLLVLIYSGLFHNVVIEKRTSPYPKLLIAYRFGRGPYENCGSVLQATCDIAPRHRTLGIYYDNPDNVPAKDLRWIVGSVLAENDEVPNSETVKLLQDNGYRLKTLPKVQNVVRTTFPFKNRISVYLAIFLVWRKLSAYIRKTQREAHPWIELYTDKEIHFIGILDQHDAFYVDEAAKVKDDN